MKIRHIFLLVGIVGLSIGTGTLEYLYELMMGTGERPSAPASRDELARHRALREAKSRALLALGPDEAIAG